METVGISEQALWNHKKTWNMEPRRCGDVGHQGAKVPKTCSLCVLKTHKSPELLKPKASCLGFYGCGSLV